MNKKIKALMIVDIIFGIIALAGAFISVGAAFRWGFIVDLEYAIAKALDKSSFNILLWGIVICLVCVAVIIISLCVSDDKSKKAAVRQRRVQKL